MQKNENILIIKHGALGDLIQADGIIKSIRYEHKNAKLVLLTSKKFINLMSMCPYIDDQLIDNRSSFVNIFSLINLYKNLKRYNFKKIYDLQNSQRTYIYRKYLFKKIKFIENKPLPKNVKFVDKNKFYGAQLTSGAIFNVELDLSHPINYGYYKKDLSIFRNTNIYIENDEIGFNNPIKYSKENTLISGYISKYNMKSIVNSRPFVNHKLKKGSVNIFTENTNFRAFWYGTNKLMMNAIFFAKIM